MQGRDEPQGNSMVPTYNHTSLSLIIDQDQLSRPIVDYHLMQFKLVHTFHDVIRSQDLDVQVVPGDKLSQVKV